MLAISLGCACAPTPRSVQIPPSAHSLVGKASQVVERPDLDGRLRIFPVRGRLTILDFWAVNCRPCLQALPTLEALSHQADISVIGVAADDDSLAVKRILQRHRVTYPNVLDDEHLLAGQYLVPAVPRTFVIDPSGVIRFVARGNQEDALKAVVDALRSEQKDEKR